MAACTPQILPAPNLQGEDDLLYDNEMLLEEDDADEDMISEQDVSNSDEDMVCDDVVSFKTSEEDEDMVSEYVHNSDEDMISDEEYIDTSKKDDKKKVDKKPLRMPQIALITARNRHKPSLTTKPPTTSTPPFAPQQEGKQMMHTTVQMASSDSLTLIGILKNKESVHRSCFLGFFCGGGYNYKEKQAIVQRSTEFHWLSRFIKAFKCTSVDLNFHAYPTGNHAKDIGDYGAVMVMFSSRELSEQLESMGCSLSKGTTDAYLLAQIYLADLPNRGVHLILFILAYYAANGCLLYGPEQLLLGGVNLVAKDKTILTWMQTELATLNIMSNIVGQETDPVYNLTIGKKELMRNKALFLSAMDYIRMAQIPLHHKLVDLETLLTTGMTPYGDTPAATNVPFYDYLGVDGLADPLTRVIGQDTCVMRLAALNQFLLGLGMASVKDTRECRPIEIAAHLRSMDPTKNDLAKKYHDMCMKRIRETMPNNVVNGTEGFHPCDLCPKSYPTRDMLTAHKVEDHEEKGERECKCDQCGMVLSTRTTLRLHKFNLHPYEQTCGSCNATFENFHAYYAHKVFMHQYEWKDCDATFYSQQLEPIHDQRMDEDEKQQHHSPHPGCEASFGNRTNPDLSDVLVDEEASSKDLQELVDQLVSGGSKSGKRSATAAGLSSPTNAVKKKIGAMDQLLTRSHAGADNIPRIVFSNVPVHDQLVFVELIKNSPLHATVILDKSNIEEATHVISYVGDPSTMRTPSYLYAINDSRMHIMSAKWVADSITNCKWMDEEYYKVAIPRKDVLQGIQLTFIGNPYPLRHAIERASKVSGAHILGQNLAPHDGMDTSKITQDLTSNNIDPNIPICIVTDEEAFVQESKNVQVRTIKWLIEVLAHQREIIRV
ncbi:hypothetical protein O0I10_000660 [Lichtheimia ornata]|uniref:C2H2-type domain-containing protein n=1 Tax=Lichtheimia ornata TaxID=688661 RepID=A0AAD8DIL4_9FUNG|nr:uncharacterized protein O0I10_000660 [Lichtheimia ornata]KAJ8663421.1 hypothetical protein O0I10_000660 [Lichtheimia ornata]